MYHHQVTGLSNVKSTKDYGYSFSSHWEAWMIKEKIVVYFDWMKEKWYSYSRDDGFLFGEGPTRESAIEDLFMAMDE